MVSKQSKVLQVFMCKYKSAKGENEMRTDLTEGVFLQS